MPGLAEPVSRHRHVRMIQKMPTMEEDDERARPRRDSNALRASVFDAFLQLGGMEKDSVIANWMFADPSVPLQVLERPTSPPLRFSGSRFRECLESDTADHVEDTRASRDRTVKETGGSKASKFFARVRSKSRPRKEQRKMDDREVGGNLSRPLADDKEVKSKSKKIAFLPFKSKPIVPPLPTFPPSVASSRGSSPAEMNVTPSVPMLDDDDEWERISISASTILNMKKSSHKRNPFLSGAPAPSSQDFPRRPSQSSSVAAERETVPNATPVPPLQPPSANKLSGLFSNRSSLAFRRTSSKRVSHPNPPAQRPRTFSHSNPNPHSELAPPTGVLSLFFRTASHT